MESRQDLKLSETSKPRMKSTISVTPDADLRTYPKAAVSNMRPTGHMRPATHSTSCSHVWPAPA
jgi:hypothetical protein